MYTAVCVVSFATHGVHWCQSAVDDAQYLMLNTLIWLTFTGGVVERFFHAPVGKRSRQQGIG